MAVMTARALIIFTSTQSVCKAYIISTCNMSCLDAIIYRNASIAVISAATVSVILDLLLSVFGTLANGLIIIAYYRNSRLRTVQNTIFILLAITDISVTAFVQPTSVATTLRGIQGEPDCLLSNIDGILTTMFVFLSLVTAAILSLQSYITLAYPYRYHNISTKPRLTTIVVISWLLVIVLQMAIVLYQALKAYIIILIISSTIIIVVFTWCWTYKLVSRHRKAIATLQTPSTSDISSRKKMLRSTVTTLAVILSLLRCYVFGLCFILFNVLIEAWSISLETHHIMSLATTTLIFLNSSLNPCLLLWRSRDFRETVRNIFHPRLAHQQ